MRLSAESKHFLQKQLKEVLKPSEIVGGAILSTLIWAVVYACCCFSVRYTDDTLSMLGVLIPLFACMGSTLIAVTRFKRRVTSRAWISAAILAWAGFGAGYVYGDRYWWNSMADYYTWNDMATYVNIDPDSDRGQSYMDAGTVYFKDGSYVLSDHAIAFRNGQTYCVAPIVKAPIEYQEGSAAPETVNGFIVPRSGTVDFWAVGTDCCGSSGNTFDCGDTNSLVARSGLRILDDSSRSMYLLGVQEWSATTGLPVRHPLFFRWTKDPILYEEILQKACTFTFAVRLVFCFVASLFGAFVVHSILQKLRVT